MAQIVAAMASVHVPLLTSAPQMADSTMWEKIHHGFDTLRDTLTASGADTLVVISDEHFNALDPRRYPSFGVVTAATGVGPVENWLGIPRNTIKVNFVPFEFYQVSSKSGQRSEMLDGCVNHPIHPSLWPYSQYTWLRVRS